MNTAEYIIKRLEELGVNEFFGFPGENNFNILRTIEKNQNTHYIGCISELNAGYAADGYAKIRGYGALITTYGAGELSALSAIAGSMAEYVPVVHIVGLPSTKNTEVENNQDFTDMFKDITVAKALLNRDNAKLEIDRVLKILVKEKRPVYIGIPSDIAITDISDRIVSYEWLSDKENLNTAAEKIAEKIKNAQNPVILGDVLVKRFDARIEYKEFVEKSGIPVSNFLMGLNLIDMDYEKYIGGYFGKYKNPIAQKNIEETDCLIAVGVLYGYLNSFGKNLPYDVNNHVAIYGTYAYVDGVRYDNVKMSELLEAVTNLIETKVVKFDKPNIGLKDIGNADSELTTSYAYYRIQSFIHENDIIVCETDSVSHCVAQMKLPPSVEVCSQNMWDSSGYATAATLGVCLAKPQSRVILITGDGAHQKTAMEVGTMLKLGIRPIIVVMNNNGYMYNKLLLDSSTGTFNDNVKANYAKFARVFDGDIWTTKVTTSEDFDKALKVTQIMNKLCYIEANTDSLDAMPLTKMLAASKITNEQRNDNTISEGSDTSEDTVEYTGIADSSSVEYETVVHKVFLNEMEGESNE